MTIREIDILAYLEGGLDEESTRRMSSRLAVDDKARGDMEDMAGGFKAIKGAADRLKTAFADSDALAAEMDYAFGPADGPDMFELPEGVKPDPLPEAMRRELAQRNKDSLAARVLKSVERLTGKSGEAAKSLAGRLTSGAGATAASPAIRKDATKVDDEEDSGKDPKDS